MKRRASQSFKANLIAHLRKIRLDAGLTQQQLAEKIGEPQSFVSKYEAGEKRLDLYQLKTICEVSGVNLIFFIKKLEDDRE